MLRCARSENHRVALVVMPEQSELLSEAELGRSNQLIDERIDRAN
jgi:hypothetical protein